MLEDRVTLKVIKTLEAHYLCIKEATIWQRYKAQD